MVQNIGLLIFVLVQATNVAGLGIDSWLHFAGLQTISHRVWEGWWQVGAIIVAWQILGAIGISMHFWFD